MKILPILSDPNFIPALHRELGPGQSRRWLHPALQVGTGSLPIIRR